MSFADVHSMSSVDAGGGWLNFALSPAKLAVHPADSDSHHELYLMVTISATLSELRSKGAEVARDISIKARGYGRNPKETLGRSLTPPTGLLPVRE